MNDPNDRLLRDTLRSLGDEARKQAPAFGAMWRDARESAAARPSAAARNALRFGGVAATAAAAAALILFAVRAERLPSDEEALLMARSLSSWSAPSDGLLAMGGPAVPSEPPTMTIESIPLPTGAGDSAANDIRQALEITQ